MDLKSRSQAVRNNNIESIFDVASVRLGISKCHNNIFEVTKIPRPTMV